MTDFFGFGWMLDPILKYLPVGSEIYLVASFLISFLYFIALTYDSKRLRAPHFIEWVRLIFITVLLFIFVIIFVIINHSLISRFLHMSYIDFAMIFFFLSLIILPFIKIVLKTGPTNELILIIGRAVPLLALCMAFVLDFGTLGGQIIRSILNWTPTYAAYIPTTALLCFMLVFVGVEYLFFFTRLEARYLEQKKRTLSNALKQPHRLIIGVTIVIFVSSLIFAVFFYNDYRISEGTAVYVARDYLGNFNSIGVLEKTVNISLQKKFFFETPFEACDGWNVSGDIGNDSLRLINSTSDNFTVTCTKKLDSINATFTVESCINEGNSTTCRISIEVVDAPFRSDVVGRIYNFQNENITCSRIEIKGKDNLTRMFDEGKNVQNNNSAIDVVYDQISYLRIDYLGERGSLVLEHFRTFKPAQFNITAVCQHS